jgi:hypothetical protein
LNSPGFASRVSELAQIIAYQKTPDSTALHPSYEVVREAHPTKLSFLCGLCAFARDIPIFSFLRLLRSFDGA